MRYGPVPTGLRLAGASRDLAPLKGSKTCFGMIAPGDPQKTIGQNGSGFAKTTLTVWLSSFSTLVTSLCWPAVVAALAGSAADSHVKTTSSGVRGVPSCPWTPFLWLSGTAGPQHPARELAPTQGARSDLADLLADVALVHGHPSGAATCRLGDGRRSLSG